jgi:glutathione peroxidase-family protein
MSMTTVQVATFVSAFRTSATIEFNPLYCRWNFTKFLIDRDGNVVGRYFSTSTPSEIEKDIVQYL